MHEFRYKIQTDVEKARVNYTGVNQCANVGEKIDITREVQKRDGIEEDIL